MPVYIDTYLSYKWPDYVAGAYAKVCIGSRIFHGMASIFLFYFGAIAWFLQGIQLLMFCFGAQVPQACFCCLECRYNAVAA